MSSEKLMNVLKTLIVAAVLVVIGVVGFAYSGRYDISATSPHGGLVNWLLSTTSHASIEHYAREIEVPDLSDAALARAGVSDFNSMCVECHGAPGVDPEAMALGLNPPAPDLAEEAEELNAAELFWVTKNGIKMTGMPAWGATHDDDALWPVIAFVMKLPELDAAAYQAFLADAQGQGHHAEEEEHVDDSDNHGHDDSAVTTDEKPHDDGHDHKH